MSLKEGSIVKIKSFKHNGKLHRVWEKNLILSQSEDAFITVNDQVIVTEADGSYWRTKEPAVSLFNKNHWFNVVGIIHPNGIKYYCNLASPIQVEDGELHYIDYDLDVEMDQGNPRRLLDEDEYRENGERMCYPADVKNAIAKNLDILYQWIDKSKGPFQKDFVHKWYRHYQQLDVKWDENV